MVKNKYIKLLLSIIALFIFAFVLLPMLDFLPSFSEMAKHNHEQGIDAQSLFYTETDEFEGADNYFRSRK